MLSLTVVPYSTLGSRECSYTFVRRVLTAETKEARASHNQAVRPLYAQQVSERDEDGDSEAMCVVCFTEPKTATIVHADTGHVCCCMECAKRLKVMRQPCPICRQPIDAVIRHFNS